MTREDCVRLDATDPLAGCRAQFELPDGVIYLDGNSLGPITRSARRLINQRLGEWQQDLIASWRRHDWLEYPAKLGAMLAPVLGAQANEITVVDSTSINLFKLAAAVVAQGNESVRGARRRRIVTEQGNFPTVPYMLEGLARIAPDVQLDVVPRERLLAEVGETTALVVLTHAHYLSAELFDLPRVTAEVQARGAQILWDLSHSAGVMPLDLNQARVDYAVGCGYKYLNGGPGAPAYLYVREDLQSTLPTVLSGWLGAADPFAFADAYAPGAGLDRFRCGTPPVLAYAALEGALEVFQGVDLQQVREKSCRLSAVLMDALHPAIEAGTLQLASPRGAAQRGGHVSLHHPQAERVIAELAALGVVGDFRPPDIIRFGFSPLYVRHVDVWQAAQEILHKVA